MHAVCFSLVLLAGHVPHDAVPAFGTLRDGPAAKRDVAYAPREGDLVFFDDHNPFWLALFAYAGTGPPLHMGLVVKLPEGKFGVLEAGPDDTVWVTLQDLPTRLKQFHETFPHGDISIRRCKKELTPETSRALSRFAIQQEGKPYAVLRLLQQGTRFSLRGPVREWLLGETYLDRYSWICSELAVAGATVAGICPMSVKANVSYPRDLIDNRRHDLSAVWHDALLWSRNSEPARKTR